MQPYGDPLQQTQNRLRMLDEENVGLRNKLIHANEENFNLLAAMATCEAEAKFLADQEVKQLKSELSFKDKELQDLSQECKRLLKEVVALRQLKSDKRMTLEAVEIGSECSDAQKGTTDSTTRPLSPPQPPPPIHSASLPQRSSSFGDVHGETPDAPPASSAICTATHKLVKVAYIVDLFHQVAFYRKAGLSVQSTEPTPVVMSTPTGSASTYSNGTLLRTYTSRLFTFQLTDRLDSATEQAKTFHDDEASSLLVNISYQLSALVTQMTIDPVWDSRALLSSIIKLCAQQLEGDGTGLKWEDTYQIELFLLCLHMLSETIASLWMEELRSRPTHWTQPQLDLDEDGNGCRRVLDTNLGRAFDSLAQKPNASLGTKHDGNYVRSRWRAPQALQLPAHNEVMGAKVTTENSVLATADLLVVLRELMEFLSSLRTTFLSSHQALSSPPPLSPASSCLVKRNVEEMEGYVIDLLKALLGAHMIHPSYQLCIANSSVVLFGSIDSNARPGLLWVLLMHPHLPAARKIDLVAAARAILTRSDSGIDHFLATQYFSSENGSQDGRKKRKSREAQLEIAPSGTFFLVQQLAETAWTLRAPACVEEAQRVRLDIEYSLELASLLLDLLRGGGERFLAALLGLHPQLAELEQPGEKRTIAVEVEDAIVRPKKKRPVQRLADDSDDDGADGKEQSAAPGEERHTDASFALANIMSNPHIVGNLDCTALNAIYSAWAQSWRSLDMHPQLDSEDKLALVAAQQLTVLVNELVASLGKVSSLFCKVVLRDCLSHVDAFMCRHCTNALHPALQLPKSQIRHLQSLAE